MRHVSTQPFGLRRSPRCFDARQRNAIARCSQSTSGPSRREPSTHSGLSGAVVEEAFPKTGSP